MGHLLLLLTTYAHLGQYRAHVRCPIAVTSLPAVLSPSWQETRHCSVASNYFLNTQDIFEQGELIESSNRLTSWMMNERINLDISKQFSCLSLTFPSRDRRCHSIPQKIHFAFLSNRLVPLHVFFSIFFSDLLCWLILLLSWDMISWDISRDVVPVLTPGLALPPTSASVSRVLDHKAVVAMCILWGWMTAVWLSWLPRSGHFRPALW